MTTTCGVFVINPNKEILICHPTHHPIEVWSIPKGQMEEGESEVKTAIRELHEETGIDMMKVSGTSVLLGTSPYHNGKKQLFAFAYILNNLYTEKLHCSSMVDMGDPNAPFPELDDFKWVKYDEAMKLLHYTQQELLKTLEGRLV